MYQGALENIQTEVQEPPVQSTSFLPVDIRVCFPFLQHFDTAQVHQWLGWGASGHVPPKLRLSPNMIHPCFVYCFYRFGNCVPGLPMITDKLFVGRTPAFDACGCAPPLPKYFAVSGLSDHGHAHVCESSVVPMVWIPEVLVLRGTSNVFRGMVPDSPPNAPPSPTNQTSILTVRQEALSCWKIACLLVDQCW